MVVWKEGALLHGALSLVIQQQKVELRTETAVRQSPSQTRQSGRLLLASRSGSAHRSR